MKRKISIIILIIILTLKIFGQKNLIIAKNHFEVSLKYALQRPFYSLTTPLDIVALSHENKYRTRLGVGCRYSVFEKWFLEYILAYSQESGVFKKQFTNTNYL